MNVGKSLKWKEFQSILKQGVNNFANSPDSSEVDILETLYDQIIHQTEKPAPHLKAQTPPLFPKDERIYKRAPGAIASQNPTFPLMKEKEQETLYHPFNPDMKPEDSFRTLEYNIERDGKPEQNIEILFDEKVSPAEDVQTIKEKRRQKWQDTLDFNPDNGHFISPKDPKDAFLRKFETPQQTRQRMDGYYYTDAVPADMDEQEYHRQKAEKDDFYQANVIRDSFNRLVEDELAEVEGPQDRKDRHDREQRDLNAAVMGEDEGYRDVLTGHLQNKILLHKKLTAEKLGQDQEATLVQYAASPASTSDTGHDTEPKIETAPIQNTPDETTVPQTTPTLGNDPAPSDTKQPSMGEEEDTPASPFPHAPKKPPIEPPYPSNQSPINPSDKPQPETPPLPKFPKIDRQQGTKINWKSLEEKGEEGYNPQPHYPHNKGTDSKSGVTIGSGFDLGQHDEAELKRIGIPDYLIEKLRPALGVKGLAAEKLIENGAIQITKEETRHLTDLIQSHNANKIIKAFDNNNKIQQGKNSIKFTELSPELQTLVMSIGYQYGVHGAPTFFGHLAAGDWNAAKAEIDGIKWDLGQHDTTEEAKEAKKSRHGKRRQQFDDIFNSNNFLLEEQY